MRHFNNLHPLSVFFYYALAIAITMIWSNPLVVGASLIFSVVLLFLLEGGKKTLKSLMFSFPIMLVIGLSNPLFVQKGATVLFKIFDLNITLESLLYGLSSGAMLISVFYWFRSYSIVMTSDKFLYLFKPLPKTALLISMTLGFVPKLKRVYREILDANKTMGQAESPIKTRFRILDMLLTHALENSVETADSMRARGYGLKPRSRYYPFKWRGEDTLFFVLSVILCIGYFAALLLNGGTFVFYPELSTITFKTEDLVFYLSILGVFILPIVFHILHSIKSSIVLNNVLLEARKCPF